MGSVIGAAAGAAAGEALATGEEAERLHDERLDDEIGVTGGDLGVAPPDQPPARFGAFSGASAGAGNVGADDAAPVEGPMPKSS